MKILHFGDYEAGKSSDPIKVQPFLFDGNDKDVVNVGRGAFFCFPASVSGVCGSLCGCFVCAYLSTWCVSFP